MPRSSTSSTHARSQPEVATPGAPAGGANAGAARKLIEGKGDKPCAIKDSRYEFRWKGKKRFTVGVIAQAEDMERPDAGGVN